MKPNHLRKAFWRNPKEFEQGVVPTLTALGQELQRRADERLANKVDSSSLIITPQPQISVPTMNKLGKDPINKMAMQGALRDITNFEKKTKGKYKIFQVPLTNGSTACLIRIPRSKDYHRLQCNEFEFPFLDDLLSQFEPVESTKGADEELDEEQVFDTSEPELYAKLPNKEVAATHLLRLIASRYPKAFQSAAPKCPGVFVAHKMNAIETQAMITQSGINWQQAEIVASHLRAHFGKTVISGRDTKKKSLRARKSDLVLAQTGCF